MASYASCPRCRMPSRGTDTLIEPARDCPKCVLETARIPLGQPQHLECRWYRDRSGVLQRKWTRVETRAAGTQASTADDAATSDSERRVAAAEMWLKVMVHAAGFAALAAAPSVAAFLTHFSDQLRLLP